MKCFKNEVQLVERNILIKVCAGFSDWVGPDLNKPGHQNKHFVYLIYLKKYSDTKVDCIHGMSHQLCLRFFP